MDHQIINKVRERHPLIHHITNGVTVNFSANGVLAFGGAPVMTNEEAEAREMALHADGVLLNIGTVSSSQLASMIEAGKAANETGAPVVLDPVGVAATPFRRDAIQKILHNVKPTIIKGNAGEMAYLAGVTWEMKGVDSVGEGNTDDIAKKAAEQYQSAIVISGKTDVFHVHGSMESNTFGHPYLTQVTGAGCLLGTILTACLTTDDPLSEQILTALEFYGRAAEYAANTSSVSGPGTFLPRFVDALSLEPGQL